MLIKHEKNKITFVFQDKNINFDFGMMLINQLSLPNALYGKNQIKRGKEAYEIPLKNCIVLTEKLPEMTIMQNVKCITDIFECIMKLEELDIVTKYGLWCKYEHLFWDTKNECIKFAVLPLSDDIEYEDGYGFGERLQETISFIAGYLPFNIQKTVIETTEKYVQSRLQAKDVIKILKNLTGSDAELEPVSEVDKEPVLTLVFLRNDNVQEYIMEKEEILVGKNLGNVDIDFSEAPAVSRLHAKLVKQNKSFFIQDLDSLNHTLVNGERVPPYEYMELANRDLITLGDVEIRVIIDR